MDNPERWNSEEKRLERKERLNSLKTKDGGKKPVKKSSRFFRIFVTVISTVIVLGILTWGAIYFAIPQKLVAPAKIGSTKVSDVEFKFYSFNALQELQIDKKSDEGKAKLKEKCTVEGYTEKTWKEYVDILTLQSLVEIKVQYDLAMAAKMTLTAEEIKAVDDMFAGLIEQQGSEVKADKYLIDLLGNNVTIKTLKPIFMKQSLASKYAQDATAKITVTDAEIKSRYEKDKNTYDTVSFRLALFTPETKDGATDAEKKKFDDAAKAAADSFIAKVDSEATFKKLADEKTAKDEKAAYDKKSAADKKTADEAKAKADKEVADKIATMTPGEKEAYLAAKANQDQTILRGLKKENIDGVSTDMGSWLFDTSRKAGDKKSFKTDSGYYALYFVEREISSSNPTVRHILISPNKTKADEAQKNQTTAVFTAAEWTAARTKANDLLKQCTSLDKFIELAKANTADTASATTGGLYENITRGQMMPEFNDWCFDPSRKAADQGIVRTDYGFHIMRFIEVKTKTSYETNSDAIKQLINAEKYKVVLDEKKALPEYKYTINELGIALIG